MCVSVCLSVSTCVCLCVCTIGCGFLWCPVEGFKYSGAGVTGGCETPNTSFGNQIQVV